MLTAIRINLGAIPVQEHRFRELPDLLGRERGKRKVIRCFEKSSSDRSVKIHLFSAPRMISLFPSTSSDSARQLPSNVAGVAAEKMSSVFIAGSKPKPVKAWVSVLLRD
jgi:hypothetical protein